MRVGRESGAPVRRVLVADDNEDIRRDIVRLLSGDRKRASLGARAARLFPGQSFDVGGADETGPAFEVAVAASGDEALEIARAARRDGDPIGVAFIDVRMPPGIDGSRVARVLRDEDPDVEIVLITAYADRGLTELNAGAGGADRLLFLKKPYAREEVYQLALSLSEKRQNRRELRNARERLDAILAASRDGLLGLDKDHRIVFANPAARLLLRLAELDSVCLWEELERHRPRALPGGGAIEVEIGGRWLELGDVSPAACPGDLSAVLAIRDVTARKEVERLKDEFVQNTSHELRTPLVAIRGYLDLALEERLGELAAPLKRGLDVARRASARLLDLIDALLELSRLEAHGGEAIAREPISLAELVEHAVSVVRPSIAAKGLELVLDLDRAHDHVIGDSRTLEVAIRNLLGNAVKFTAKGKVGVSSRAHGDQVEVSIWDTGCGLPAGIDPKVLFERFRQADGGMSRAHGGVGIGLSLVERILSLHGATVDAGNRAEGGARFSFDLERARPGAKERSPDIGLRRPRAHACSVLVVDSTLETREFLRFALTAAEHNVCAAPSVEAALDFDLEGCGLVIVEHRELDRVRRALLERLAPEDLPRIVVLIAPGADVAIPDAFAVLEKPIAVARAIELAASVAHDLERREAA